ncbi:glycosyltransferase family 4 protein [Paenibacillus gorillae]|uniref:glycosyltransferase family 4 protein n=1 Tax=Paenibacillus gorillae TaxID=1243662 RepID=UPI0004ADCF7C|nr:glycosyltransferase family 1 protein [Paenibacillus gorillae]
MNIAIDVLAILGPDSKNRGIGNYTTSHLKKMFELDKENRYFLINFYEDTSLKDILNYSDNVSEHYFYLGSDGFLGKEIAFNSILGGIVKKFIQENDIQVYYFTSPVDSLISYDIEWFSEIQTVATLYDIIPYVFKERYLTDKTTYKRYMAQMNNLKRMDKLLAISKNAKDDFIKHFNVHSSKVDVIYAGTDECYRKIEISSLELQELKNRYGIEQKYIMCTGGDDDRKNISKLIEAYAKMPQSLINEYQLVIACKLSKQSEERYYVEAAKFKVRERVILTNFVPLDHLIQLYNLAHIVAFPSQYEGFGLPVVEAMACGTPVLTSNNSSLGEIAEGAAVLVDPFNTKDMTRGLVEILQEADLEYLIHKGTERVKMFTWDMVAQSTITSINSIKITEVITVSENKKKIAFFTPLPPLKSGISDYSVDILNELSKYFVIDVFIDKNYKPDCHLADTITVYDHGKFKSRENNYQEIIYQMGNSEYHAYMLDYIKENPGTLVLHDYNLHGLLFHLVSTKENIEQYKKYLYEDYDKEQVNRYVNDFQSGKVPPRLYEIPSNGIVTNYSNKIIVHSDYAKRLLLEKDIQRNVKKIESYAEIKELDSIAEARTKLNINQDNIVLSAFGHIHETKRIMPVLKAFQKNSFYL